MGTGLGLSVAERPDIKDMATEYRIVTPGYLESIGIGARQGRTISSADRRDAERVVVINEALAQKYFAGVDPIGKLMGGDADVPSRIVGVVANAAEKRLIDPAEPVRYVALAQMPWMDDAQSLVLRAMPGVDETSLLEPARQHNYPRGSQAPRCSRRRPCAACSTSRSARRVRSSCCSRS